MTIEQPGQSQPPDGTPPQVNDLFDSVELAKAIDTEEFKHFLDHIPIALVVSKHMRGEHRIVYANKAFEIKTGRALSEIRGRGWSILDEFRHEEMKRSRSGKHC